MKVNKYFPVVLIYFFVNSLFLPFGLTYTSLLAPLFYIWILLARKKEVVLPFLLVLLPFICVHLFFIGVDQKSYFISLLNLIAVYISCQAVYTFFKVCADPEKIFARILVINFILCLVAVVVFFTPWYETVWIQQDYTRGVQEFKRLKLFTYEASYYATLFTPLFFFFFLQYLFGQNKIKTGWLLLMLFVPLILSFSIGVIGSILIASFITWIIYFHRLTVKRRILNWVISSGAVVGAALFTIILFFRHNPVFTRIGNIFSGEDLSARGRTVDAFAIAGKLLEQKDKYWGIGLGQIKIVGADIIRGYYLYPPEYRIAIPNTVAETLAMFGWVGIFCRFGVEIFLFFYTRAWNNYFRLLLFLFIFTFQFAGSFTTNIAEYVIWILAFTNVFPQFNVSPNQRELRAFSIASS